MSPVALMSNTSLQSTVAEEEGPFFEVLRWNENGVEDSRSVRDRTRRVRLADRLKVDDWGGKMVVSRVPFFPALINIVDLAPESNQTSPSSTGSRGTLPRYGASSATAR